ncbi:hypothetical protein DIURU_001180 [Diutina rugosa]|uniref:ATP11 protein n=1 Tax=Diutina rugosa TaxID=5481 RepID=A0A642UVH1_DIURU|nr:uncharacterized protein DIURU_001180 [Diutina rugosa]KAA8906238.1 hypothetical protein DIURU_001180 [Diutina rugosa]
MFRSILRQPRVWAPARHYLRLNSSLAAKYEAKLAEKAKQLGLKDVEELKQHLKDEIEEKKKQMNHVDPLKELEEFERQQQQEYDQDRQRITKDRGAVDPDAPKLPYKTLDSYIDAAKVKGLPLDDVEAIWRARWSSNDRSLHAVVKAESFMKMYANAFKNPSFILPVPKGEDGYEMNFVQWSFPGPQTTHCMVTTVAEYKLHKEYAKPHTTLEFHQELMPELGVVLMNGHVDKDSSVSMDEAHLTVLNIQRFYSGDDEAKLQLLRSFTAGDENFDIKRLVEESTSV